MRILLFTLLGVSSRVFTSVNGNISNMAWRCSGQTQAELVENLRSSRIITSPSVIQALKTTDRAYYLGVPESVASSKAYLDQPQGIGHSQTISAPHMVRNT